MPDLENEEEEFLEEFFAEEAWRETLYIKVFGVGDIGISIINHMIKRGWDIEAEGIPDLPEIYAKYVDFIAVDSDAHSPIKSATKNIIQADDLVDTKESDEIFNKVVSKRNMTFIIVGTDKADLEIAAIVAERSRKAGVSLTIGIVVNPLNLSEAPSIESMEKGSEVLCKYADMVILIPPDRLMANENKNNEIEGIGVTIINETLRQLVQNMLSFIYGLIYGIMDCDILADFFSHAGLAYMGIGSATGENAAVDARRNAMQSSMMVRDIRYAKGIFVGFMGSPKSINLVDFGEACNELQEVATTYDIGILPGISWVKNLKDTVECWCIATGFDGYRRCDLLPFSRSYAEGSRAVIIGIGGGGNRAINLMIESGLDKPIETKGGNHVYMDYIAIDTDKQTLEQSQASKRILIGEKLTNGHGTNGKLDLGEQAAREVREEFLKMLKKYDYTIKMAYIITGMGGGTGSGASHIVAEILKNYNRNINVFGLTTTPFVTEETLCQKNATTGIDKLQNIKNINSKFSDIIVNVIPTVDLLPMYNDTTTRDNAFEIANDRLRTCMQFVVDVLAGRTTSPARRSMASWPWMSDM